MASTRKKQDEKNLKFLRELVSLTGNKHCFDCNQRGPTYVNMTIGSFVCTKCSGMLRGLTPPHRVKSISMASFTTEEVDFVKSKGNDYCRQTWLALYDQNTSVETKDEQQIKDFMIDKYERKRYYHDKGLFNGTLSTSSVQKAPVIIETVKPAIPRPTVNGTHNGFSINGNHHIINNTSNNNNNNKNANPITNGDNKSTSSNDFVADFSTANFISTSQFNNNSSNSTSASQPNFANFDNNIIFNSANVSSPPFVNGNLSTPPPSFNKIQSPPSEDRYAALKDLDNALKSQQLQHEQQQQHNIDWNTATSSNGSGYPSPLYGSPSSINSNGGSMYGSPSQGTFASAFVQQQDLSLASASPSSVSNPFNSSPRPGPWSPNGNNVNQTNTVIANNCFPISSTTTTAAATLSPYTNGISNGANPFRSTSSNDLNVIKFNNNGLTTISNGNSPFGGNNNNGNSNNNMFIGNNSSHFMNKPIWTNPSPNPFALGVTPGTNGNSNNPFL